MRRVNALIAFWSHALAACLFAALMLWRLGEPRATGGSACLLARLRADRLLGLARRGPRPTDPLIDALRKARATSSGSAALQPLGRPARSASTACRLVYGAVAAVIGLQLARPIVLLSAVLASLERRPVTETGLLRDHDCRRARWSWSTMSTARPRPRAGRTSACAMLGLALIWVYDLNLYTVALSRLARRRARCSNGAAWSWRSDRAAVRAGAARKQSALARSAVARGDLPVALAARDLRLFRADGDPRHRASRHRWSTGRQR